MKKQCLVIGLGTYGMNVAKKLEDSNIEVLAIDKNMKIVEKAAKFATKAICLDVTSLDAFESLPIKDFDVAVVGIGEDISASIITCLALKEAGVNYIIAKAGDQIHKRIISQLEVNEVVLPEEYLGKLTARSIIENEE